MTIQLKESDLKSDAKDLSGQAPGGQRQVLADILPLSTPLVVQIFPVYACNFKCGYCIFSVEPEKRDFLSDTKLLSHDLYRRCVDEMSTFPNKIKVLRFVGVGEPLIHKNIVDMVAYTVEKKVASTVEIVTNGVLLDPTRIDSLVEAGLGRLVISLQGTTAERYKEVAGVPVDYDKFLRNLEYLSKNKKNMHVYIKIIDTALTGPDDREKFFELFGGFCDSIAVENTIPIHKAIDFSGILGGKKNDLTQYGLGLPSKPVAICPQPFFHMQINPDGKVVPCYSWEYPGIMGDCNEESIVDIWNGDKFRKFRLKMLDGLNEASEACKSCNIITYRWFPEDDLTKSADRLRKLYS